MPKRKPTRVATLAEHEVKDVLALPWSGLNKKLMRLVESDVVACLAFERRQKKRLHVMLRLQSRLSKLRHARERRELLELATQS